MNIGSRIIYDQDGEILFQFGEMSGDILPRKEITQIKIKDIEFGSIDLTKNRIVSINPKIGEPILETIEIPLTDEQKRIIEIENQLLLLEGVI